MRIIVDAFGGDNAPLEILKGSAMAVQEYGVELLVTGPEAEIRRVAGENGISLDGMTIVDTPDVITMEDEPLATLVQNMRKGSKWLSAFLESYRPPLDGERYLTDREVAELLRVSRRTLQEYRNNRVLPFILLGGKVLYPESGLRELLEANYRKPME